MHERANQPSFLGNSLSVLCIMLGCMAAAYGIVNSSLLLSVEGLYFTGFFALRLWVAVTYKE